MYHIFSINSSFEGHLGCLQLVAIINKAAMNIMDHMSSHLPLKLPFYLPNHQFSFILQIKVSRRFTGNHLSADYVLVHNHSQENGINIKYN